MIDYARLVAEDQRLAILRLLAEAEGYDLNRDILRAALAQLGHRPSLDRMRAQLAWLAEQGLIALRMAGDIEVATLTERGADAACGRARIPGVRRPPPDAA